MRSFRLRSPDLSAILSRLDLSNIKSFGNPSNVWYSMIAIGITGTILMAVYNNVIAKQEAKI